MGHLCSYGCGQPAVFWLGRKRRACCSRHYTQCPAFQSKRRETVEARGGYSFQNPDTRKKAQIRIMEKFGVDNVGRLNTTKEKIKATNLQRYGVSNPFSSEDIKAQIRVTVLERYGVENPSQAEEVKAKKVATFREHYGVDNPQQAQVVRSKTRATVERVYGGAAPLCNPGVKAKARQTVLERYGDDAPWHRPEARQRGQLTMLARYGVATPVELREARCKAFRAAGRRKPYAFPSGRVVLLQGFEGEAITRLMAQGIAEDDILLGKQVPRIPYMFTDEWGVTTRHTYFPDIYIPSRNALVEVKSLWTFQRGPCPDGLGLNNPIFERNLTKAAAARKVGYRFYFMLKQDDGHWVTWGELQPL